MSKKIQQLDVSVLGQNWKLDLTDYATKQLVKDTISLELNDLNTRFLNNINEVELTTSAALNDLNNRLLDTISNETIDALFL